ncbi:hypothetical protein [Streptomyces sp. NPDC017964]
MTDPKVNLAGEQQHVVVDVLRASAVGQFAHLSCALPRYRP